jgi:phospholipid/cholesterol/gamma-HCH transport system substrate-binding protein
MGQPRKFIRLGIFVTIGLILFIIGIFYIGSKQSLFESTFKVKAYFKNIEGLRKGAPVRMAGINVGAVAEILFAPDTTGRVLVVLNLENDVRRFIRQNTEAYVETEGLVGNKVVNLQKGTVDKPLVKDGGLIIGMNPLGLGSILKEITEILGSTKAMSADLAGIVAKVNSGEGTLGKLVNDDRLYENTNSILLTANRGLEVAVAKYDTLATIVSNLGQNINSVVNNADRVMFTMDTLISHVDGVVSDVRSGKGIVGKLLTDGSDVDLTVKEMLAELLGITKEVKIGAGRFSENMEALKRNWLFSTYFEERGFYDKSGYEVKLEDYIEQINNKIKDLDERIKTLKELEKKPNSAKK